MEQITRKLRIAFVEAYPRYVATVLVDRGIEMDTLIADAVVEGTAVLDGLLAHLEATPAASQRQSPLELFREALRPVGRALETAGVARPKVDAGAVSIVSWDDYVLSPASSAALGSAAHDAHLRWGVWKTHEMRSGATQPGLVSVVVRCDEADREAIERQVLVAGYSVVAELSESMFCIIDIDGGTREDDLADSLDSGCRTIVFGAEIDDLRHAALRARGVWNIISRSQAMTSLGAALPAVA